MWFLHLTHHPHSFGQSSPITLLWMDTKGGLSQDSGGQMITGWTQLGQDPWTRCCLYAEDGMKELVPGAWDLLVEDANWFLAHNFLPLNEQERGYHWGSCVSWANTYPCPERGENWLCFSLCKKHSLIYPRQRLNSWRSSELEVDNGYPQNCMGVLPLAHPEPKAWAIQVGLTFFSIGSLGRGAKMKP